MPLHAAQQALANPNITKQELFERIGQTNVEIGNLYCRCKTDPQLTEDLLELEIALVKLTEKYQKMIGE
jgi:hypothetical protein